MVRIYCLCALLLSLTSFQVAASPCADVSFLVIDLKYNEQDGVKICEVQQGLGCSFEGAEFFSERKGSIADALSAFLARYFDRFWYMPRGFSHEFRKGLAKKKKWHKYDSLSSLLKSKSVKKYGRAAVNDPVALRAYHGLILLEYHYVDLAQLSSLPGGLLLNRAFLPFFGTGTYSDKLSMSHLFDGDAALERLKPAWKLYPKTDPESLADEILSEFSAEYLVIKPRTGNQGKGVIILQREELSRTLEYILSGSTALKNDPDKTYWYWAADPHADFIVEEFVPSLSVTAPHLGSGHYDGTMRVALTLTYDQGTAAVHFLHSVWKLPKLSLEAEGSLTDKHKSFSRSPSNYALVDQAVEQEVYKQLKEGFLILYNNLLHQGSSKL